MSDNADNGRTLIRCEVCGKFFYDLVDLSLHAKDNNCKDTTREAREFLDSLRDNNGR